MKRLASLAALPLALLAVTGVQADTTDVKTQSRVLVPKKGAHCVDDSNCFNRYHPAIKPVARAKTGQLITFETRDALDSDLNVSSQPKDLAAIDLNLVHPLTGPVHIEGAKRGDVLAVTLIDIDPDEYGYTTVVPGFGFLRDRFTEPFVANWKLNRLEAVSDQLPGVRIPFNGFMGTVGVLPGALEADAWAARTAATRTSACAPSRRARTAATWTSSRWWWVPLCCCPATSMAAVCSSVTCTTPKATARWPERPSRWAPR